MRRNVLIKKNKILAFVLAAAMVFTSAPMQSVYAEEANGTVTEDVSQKEVTDGESQKEATDGEAAVQAEQEETQTQSLTVITVDETDLKPVLKIDFKNVETSQLKDIFTIESGESNIKVDSTTIVAGNDSSKLAFTDKGKVKLDLGTVYDSGIVKIVVETHSTSSPSGQTGFRILDGQETQHALVNIGHLGNVSLYENDGTNDKSPYNGSNAPYIKIKDGGARGIWVKMETLIDLKASKESNTLVFNTFIYTSSDVSDPENWTKVEIDVGTGSDIQYEDMTKWENVSSFGEGDDAKKHANGCANAEAKLEVKSIELECMGKNSYIDNIQIYATNAVVLDKVQVTPPNKTTYTAGDPLVLNGMTLTETYTDGTTKELTDLDEINAEYTITGYNSTTAGTQEITVASRANPAIKDTFEVTVEAAAEIEGLKEILSYKGEVTDAAELGFTGAAEVKLDKTDVGGNTSQKLLVTDGSAVKKWSREGYALTSGVVKITAEMKKGTDAAFYRVLDGGGNPLIFIGQFSRTNLYDSQSSVSLNGTSGTPFVTVVDGSNTNWIRIETEIDLDASKAGSLKFVTKVYSQATYPADGNWGDPKTITADTYNGNSAFNTTNGCATSTLTSFSVGAVELSSRDSGKTAYFDNIEVLATDAATLREVKVKGDGPTKKDYIVGTETYDWKGLVLTETYSNGKGVDFTEDLTLEEIEKKYDITGFKTDTKGEKIITVKNKKYDTIDCNFTINVKDIKIVSIQVTPPTKQNYFVGDKELDRTGMVVTATYDDESTAPLDEYEVSPLKATEEGPETITVTSKAKNAEGNTVTDTFVVTIKQPVVESIEVTKKPSKLSYKMKEEDFNPAGMEIKATYNSGKTEVIEVAKCTIIGFDNTVEAASQIITVSYEGKKDTFTVTIVDPSKFEAIEYNFDFNNDGSDTATGWIPINVNQKGSAYTKKDWTYDPENDMPYGFVTSIDNIAGRTQTSVEANPAYVSIPKEVYQDMILTGKGWTGTGEFRVDLDNGTYNVQIITGTQDGNEVDVTIEGKYNGYAKRSNNVFKVIEIAGVEINDGTMNIIVNKDNNARINGIIISNISAPTSLTGEFISDDLSVSLRWEDSLGCVKYNVYRRAADGSTKYVATVENTSYADTSMDVLQTYTYFVRGVSEKGLETIASNEVKVTTGDSGIAKPAAPTNVTISSMTPDSVTLTWDSVEGAAFYEVYTADTTLVAKVTDATTYQVKDPNHLEKSYKVLAANAGGRSDATAATTTTLAPVTPVNVQAEPEEEFTTITWNAVENASFYEIYWSDRDRTSLAGTEYETDGIEDYELIGTSMTNSFVLNLPTHIVRYFKVAAVGVGGKSGLSELAKADIVKNFNTQAEYLDRGLIAIKTDDGIYLGWRLTGDEYAKKASYNLYRDGVGIRTFTADQNTNYLDTEGTPESKYAVSVVIDGVESEKCEAVSVWMNSYLEVPLDQPEPYWDDKLTENATYTLNDKGVYVTIGNHECIYNYKPNDTYIGDVDGDGEYELIVKWDGVSQDSSYVGYTSPVIIDCYKLDGTKLWRINLGVNIRAGAHYTQPVVADLDGDGKAEVMMKTSEGSYVTTADGKVTYVDGNTNPGDYRSSKGHVTGGPEYLTLFDGETGEVLDNILYVPQRGKASDWGDSDYNRSERYLSGAAYLDGEHLSAVFARGYYQKAVVVAFDVVGKKIVQRWVCSSTDAENKSLYGQGAHSFTVADVDGDGCQEIIYGSATIDHDGKLMYAVFAGLEGHGDAERVTDMNLKNPGLEIFMVHEGSPKMIGVEMHDGATGEFVYAEVLTAKTDVGRGASGDIDPRYEGVESWANKSLFSADGEVIGSRPSPQNHMAWFGAGMDRKFVDHSYTGEKYMKGTDVLDTGSSTTGTVVVSSVPYIAHWNYEAGKAEKILEVEACESNNTTKGNPCFQADIFGDWREEIAWRTDDNQAIRIYTSDVEMDYRLYTLMHDPTYRAQMACNGSAYNQSPDAGFYIGYDVALMQVPVPTLNIVKAEEGPADYTAVDEALEKVKGLIAEDYKNFDAVEAAIAAVVQDLPKSEQDKVDAMAAAIEKAIEELVEIPADYTEVDAAIEKAGKLNSDDYVNYAEVEADIKAAIEAVERGLLKSKQEKVNDMAKAIEDAIAALEKKPDSTETPTPDETTTPEPGATSEPGATATPAPSTEPTPAPSTEPTPAPSAEPSPVPSAEPTQAPNAEPDEEPDEEPDTTPVQEPSAAIDLSYNVAAAIPEGALTEAVKNVTGCNTVEALTEYIKQDVVAKAQSASKGITQDNIEVREVAVNVSLDGGKTWQPVTKETFPAGGIKIVLKYPAGTNKDEYDFVVSHLITIDRDDLNLKAGTIINEDYVKTDEGLELNIMSASPFAIGWSKIEETSKTVPAKTGDNMYSILWMCAVVLVGALCMMAFMVVKRRRNR